MPYPPAGSAGAVPTLPSVPNTRARSAPVTAASAPTLHPPGVLPLTLAAVRMRVLGGTAAARTPSPDGRRDGARPMRRV
jgi:hypothetical protein